MSYSGEYNASEYPRGPHGPRMVPATELYEANRRAASLEDALAAAEAVTPLEWGELSRVADTRFWTNGSMMIHKRDDNPNVTNEYVVELPARATRPTLDAAQTLAARLDAVLRDEGTSDARS